MKFLFISFLVFFSFNSFSMRGKSYDEKAKKYKQHFKKKIKKYAKKHKHHNMCHHDNEECISGERVVNGDFETDIISKNWELLSNLTGWKFHWTRGSSCGSSHGKKAYVELQKFPHNQLPNSTQYVELDTDCPNNYYNKRTNIKMYQYIKAKVGEKLSFKFNYKARRLDRYNKLKVYFGKQTIYFKNKDFNDTNWKSYEKVMTVRKRDVKNGYLKISFEDKGYADTYGIFLDNVSVKSIECEEDSSCMVSEVISYYPYGSVADNRQDPLKALGLPNGEPFVNSSQPEFVSLGICGEIVLKLDKPVKNGEGPDLRVWEVTGGNLSQSQYPESATVYGSNDQIMWAYLGTVSNDNNNPSLGEVDLGVLEEALYIKIVDSSPLNGISDDGFDLDAVTCIEK